MKSERNNDLTVNPEDDTSIRTNISKKKHVRFDLNDTKVEKNEGPPRRCHSEWICLKHAEIRTTSIDIPLESYSPTAEEGQDSYEPTPSPFPIQRRIHRRQIGETPTFEKLTTWCQEEKIELGKAIPDDS